MVLSNAGLHIQGTQHRRKASLRSSASSEFGHIILKCGDRLSEKPLLSTESIQGIPRHLMSLPRLEVLDGEEVRSRVLSHDLACTHSGCGQGRVLRSADQVKIVGPEPLDLVVLPSSPVVDHEARLFPVQEEGRSRREEELVERPLSRLELHEASELRAASGEESVILHERSAILS